MTTNLSLAEKLQVAVTTAPQIDPSLITALAFTLFGLILIVHARLQRQAQARQAAENCAAINKLAEGFETIEKNTQRIARSLQRLIQRVDQVQLNQRGTNTDLRQAVRLVRDGATSEQLIDLCGLSRGEAELFKRLHS